MEKLEFNKQQLSTLDWLWMKFGNNGLHHTHVLHRVIQDLLKGEDHRAAFVGGWLLGRGFPADRAEAAHKSVYMGLLLIQMVIDGNHADVAATYAYLTNPYPYEQSKPKTNIS